MKVINFVFLLICFILTGCKFLHKQLKFVNRSNSPVIVEISNDSTNFKFDDISYYKRNVVEKDSSYIFSKLGGAREIIDYIARGEPKKRLFLVVFSLDTLNKYQNVSDMDILFKKKKYLALKVYKKRDVIHNDWIISY